MGGWAPRQVAVLGALVAVLAAGLVVGFVRHGRAAEQGFVIERATGPASPATGAAPAVLPATPSTPPEVVVHVAGRVMRPGVYHLPSGSRAEDAIKAAGGAKPDANQDAVNLAARVEDGQQLYLPSRKEQASGGAAPAAASPHGARSASGSRRQPTGGSAIVKLRKPGSGTVDINTAGAAELQRLPGIGPAMAERILAYRKEIGRFTGAEQLMDVSGIGEKKFAKMKPFVRVR